MTPALTVDDRRALRCGWRTVGGCTPETLRLAARRRGWSHFGPWWDEATAAGWFECIDDVAQLWRTTDAGCVAMLSDEQKGIMTRALGGPLRVSAVLWRRGLVSKANAMSLGKSGLAVTVCGRLRLTDTGRRIARMVAKGARDGV